ncbi:hypothetical protein J7K24_02230 [bacterium]|nr:hypothetical protein [bacterium]
MISLEGEKIIVWIVCLIIIYLAGTGITAYITRKSKGILKAFSSRNWIILWPLTWGFIIVCLIITLLIGTVVLLLGGLLGNENL